MQIVKAVIMTNDGNRMFLLQITFKDVSKLHQNCVVLLCHINHLMPIAHILETFYTLCVAPIIWWKWPVTLISGGCT